ncbi:MAG: ImmA/IrrE family metallo-endopeptidase [Patescibacteria group bacterium]
MDKKRIEEIRIQSLSLIEEAYGGLDRVSPPIDINKIATSLGLDIKQGPFTDDEILGAFDRNKNIIYLSEKDTYTRQAFTAAHEIGHFKLHGEVVAETFYRRDIALGAEKPEEEKEADCFAASLLMPDFLVQDAWSVDRDIQTLARLFSVSTSAMTFRLKNLGFLD